MLPRTAYRPRLIALLIAAGGLFLIGNNLVPLWDRDEPRYAECSREMLHSGDWVVPRFLGDLRAHKPPFIYWCQAAAMSAFGETGFVARLPSAGAIFLTTALLAIFMWRVAGPRRAIWATIIFATSALTIAAAKMANTDAVLLLWIFIGQICIYRIWRDSRSSLTITVVLWLSIALAGLTKGPLVLAIHLGMLFVLAVLDRRGGQTWKSAFAWWRRMRPLIGLLIVVALVTPWLWLVHERAPDFLPRLLNRAGRYASSGAEGHSHWPGFYLLLIWGLFFPWSLILPPAIGMGLVHQRRPIIRFALAAALGPWLVMELVSNKLPFYILPSFPGLAILAAEAVIRGSCAKIGRRDDDLKRPGFLVGVAIWAVASLVIGSLPMFINHKINSPPQLLAAVFALLAAIYMLIVAIAFIRRRVAFAAFAMAGGFAVLIVVLLAVVLPSIGGLMASRTVGGRLVSLGAGGDTPVAMLDYREPSLAFYQGGGAREVDLSALAAENPPAWAVITDAGWSHLPAEVRSRYRVIGPPTSAVLYNDGWGVEEILIIHRQPADTN